MTSLLQTGSGMVSACTGRCRPKSDFLSINCYANYWTNGAPCYFNAVAGAGRYVNFFNPHDFALNKGWLAFQNAKRKIYASYTFDPPNTYFKDFHSTELFFPADTYELFDKVIQARCFALGAQLNAGGVFVTARQVELDNPPYNFQDTHVYHSGEFRSDNPQRWQFWNKVLTQMGLK